MDPHRLVFIDEIFQQIVWNLDDNASRLKIALCCRAFLETALDALWGDSLEGLRPLINCLPRDALSISFGFRFQEYPVRHCLLSNM